MFRPFQILLIIFIAGLSFDRTATAQPPIESTPPKDKFSRIFLRICKDAASRFAKTRGKAIKKGDTTAFVCRKLLPGSKSGLIANTADPACVFYFGTYTTVEDAEAEAQQLTSKITCAFVQRAMVKTADSSADEMLVKHTAVAELKGDGFSGYNICTDVIKNKGEPESYAVKLKIDKGQETVYRFIHKNEPVRSPLFLQTFKNIYTQFSDRDDYSCNEMLPGFTCTLIDSAGKNELMLEKKTDQFRDAQVEFESLTTSVRAMLSNSFLYYIAKGDNKNLKKTVFIHSSDLDKTERRSITTCLVRNDINDYAVRVILYHP